jgi:hypothetical protein
MKNLPLVIISFLIFGIISGGDVCAAKYSAKIDVFSNYIPLKRQPFTFFVDFGREISLNSLKMKPAAKNEQDIKIPVYAVPLSKYRALIHFMPHKGLEPDSDMSYILTFEDGKWDAKAAGDAALKKSIESAPNLVPNYSFEKIRKAQDRFLTWAGKTDVLDWRLHDYGYQFASVEDPDSTCRVSSEEAVEGTRSLCFKSGKPRQIEIGGASRNVLISGTAYTTKDIALKPNTVYKLSFFLKVTKRSDNGMNLQGAAVSMNMQDREKENLSGGIISALYSVNTKPQSTYLNKWIYVQACELTSKDTAFGRVNIAEKVSGTIYIDMLELCEIKENALPEIIVRKIEIEK